ncbi:hypothetical protein BP00DRAFT_213897 [Aspergillus indologenus CBS 114.80]|uniref:Uncharacterized protein n=1 Tax=Aspergillus indologenus CBS 114.80 TaxID=1450541 RepID=A0A2V5I048_9EURO|nr:hypothetical protein BP00DRAFT_213897 [Aspergillus indologenus CBS 114.80]
MDHDPANQEDPTEITRRSIPADDSYPILRKATRKIEASACSEAGGKRRRCCLHPFLQRPSRGRKETNGVGQIRPRPTAATVSQNPPAQAHACSHRNPRTEADFPSRKKRTFDVSRGKSMKDVWRGRETRVNPRGALLAQGRVMNASETRG